MPLPNFPGNDPGPCKSFMRDGSTCFRGPKTCKYHHKPLKEWTPENIIDDAITKVREQVGDGQVLLGLSGGVDSSVVAMLLNRAIGDKLTCVFVDNGLLYFYTVY